MCVWFHIMDLRLMQNYIKFNAKATVICFYDPHPLWCDFESKQACTFVIGNTHLSVAYFSSSQLLLLLLMKNSRNYNVLFLNIECFVLMLSSKVNYILYLVDSSMCSRISFPASHYFHFLPACMRSWLNQSLASFRCQTLCTIFTPMFYSFHVKKWQVKIG